MDDVRGLVQADAEKKKKGDEMSDQSDYTELPPPSLEEVRQHLIEQINEGERTVEELSDEELEIVTGGIGLGFLKTVNKAMEKHNVWNYATGAAIALSLPPL